MEKEQAKLRLLVEMAKHPGRSNIIGMGELYERVFDQHWTNRINDTRALRTLITELRTEGVPICSENGGYYQTSSASELEAYCQRLRSQGLNKLKLEAKLRKKTMPDLLGQIAMSYRQPPAASGGRQGSAS